jgi:molybdopterin synthase sulfur carrier subunit
LTVPVQVKVPTIFRRHTRGEAVVEGEGATLREVLTDIDSRYPGLARSVITGEGDRHRVVNVYLNAEDVRDLGALETGVKQGDVVSILPAVAGGG